MYIYMYVYIYTHIYERRKKRIYKVYTSVHTQFSMGHALPQRKEVKADRLRLSALAVHGEHVASLRVPEHRG